MARLLNACIIEDCHCLARQTEHVDTLARSLGRGAAVVLLWLLPAIAGFATAAVVRATGASVIVPLAVMMAMRRLGGNLNHTCGRALADTRHHQAEREARGDHFSEG
jgi:hypothetical protein